jgi:transposase
MARERFQVTDEQSKELQRAFTQARDGVIRTRYQAVRLYVQGYPTVEIIQITGCNRSSLMEWCRKYRQSGVAGLEEHRGGPVRAKLKPEQVTELGEKLRQYRPYDLFGPEAHTASGQHWTVEDLVRAVQRWYGVSWKNRASYHHLFVQCGYSYQRTEKVYKSRREKDVLEFEALVEKK